MTDYASGLGQGNTFMSEIPPPLLRRCLSLLGCMCVRVISNLLLSFIWPEWAMAAAGFFRLYLFSPVLSPTYIPCRSRVLPSWRSTPYLPKGKRGKKPNNHQNYPGAPGPLLYLAPSMAFFPPFAFAPLPPPFGGRGPYHDRPGRSGARETVYKNTTAFGGAAVVTRLGCI